MDTGKGVFEQVTAVSEEELQKAKEVLEAKHPNHGGWFREGETIEIRGSTFLITAVRPTSLRLKLMKRKVEHGS